MYDYELIHYTPGTALPTPWQPSWQYTSIRDMLPSIPQRRVARAPLGTPIPAGCERYSEPVVTERMRELARRDLGPIANSSDRLMSEVARSLLDDPAELDREIRTVLGVAHPYASAAPLAVPSLEAACCAHVRAGDAWASPCSTAVIRCAEKGYQVWTGIGGMMHREGNAAAYGEAEGLAADGIARQRSEAMAPARAALEGWHPDTPFYSATLSTAAQALPWSIHRGPITTDELPGKHGMGASSWDLPVVTEFRAGARIDHLERVTWSDDDSRERARAKRREGEARRKAEVSAAIGMLRANPVLAPLCEAERLTPGELKLGNGMTVRAIGPVRMREDGACALALVQDLGRDGKRPGMRMWMALGSFA